MTADKKTKILYDLIKQTNTWAGINYECSIKLSIDNHDGTGMVSLIDDDDINGEKSKI